MGRTIGVKALVLVVAVGCGSAQVPPPPPADTGPVGRTAAGPSVHVTIAGETIVSVEPEESTAWLWPPIVDSHVHLSYWPVADQLAASGVAIAVDLAAPERTLVDSASEPEAHQGIHVVRSGPMLTRVHGYPLDSWGSDGYGVGCADPACVTSSIERLAASGSRILKLALDDDGLDPSLVPLAVSVAHAHHLKVAVHALGETSAALAAAAGADLLAHTPIEPLSDATVLAWRGRAVISTLAAFGGRTSAIENLRRLRAAGAIVLYGTDLGNLRDAGPSEDELTLLAKAGLDDAAITAAMTTVPLAYWGVPLEAIAPGTEATFLVLDRDPREETRTLLTPRGVWLRGQRMR